ncbi:MAG: arylsulfatase [Planctomycetota bacterium]|jgi:arylsulfatase
MRKLITLLLISLVAILPAGGSVEAKETRPNILLIVADDLGYSDLGSYGGEINTPVLDELSEEGMRFSNYYVLPTCSPTRSALLSGNDNHVAGMGVMSEFIYPDIKDLPGYVGYLADQVATIPEILRSAGYHTYMSGKWHLGKDDEQSPFKRGFEETFTMMNGGGSHWADMKPLSQHEAMIYRRNGKRLSELPKDFYSTKDYTDSLIGFIERNKDDGKPFFAYLSYTAPHDPLHVPAEYIAKYKGKFDEGWDAFSLKRLGNLKKLGLVPRQLNELSPNIMTKKWETLNAHEKKLYARDMEVYAAMVDYMDMSIGRLFRYLKDKGLYDNTMIVFFSDNGANGAHATSYPGNADGKYLGTFNNEIENRGLPNSFIDMGAGWAQAASAPYRMFKSFTSEGGIKSPLIVKLPGKMANKGQWNHSFLHVTDIMPTFMELAGATYPETANDKPVKKPIGKSIMPILTGGKESIHENQGMGYELFEMKAYIQDEWKLLRLPVPFGTGVWEVYNLREDPGEIHDVSEKYPEKKAALIKAWLHYAEQNEVFDHKGRFDAMYRKAYGVEK